MIVIVDYKMGNLGSIHNMFSRIGVESIISGDPKVIESADKIILPGVGAFDAGMSNLKNLHLIELLNDKVIERKTPVFGICLGMQLLGKSSEEGVLPGLGWVNAESVRFNFEDKQKDLRIPHMGWNSLDITRKGSILDNLPEEPRFYFVHSYHVRCNNDEDILAKTRYGIEFVSVVRKGNIMGTQFHPEKSHKFGLALLRNFAEVR
jgi:glutamine amidotransferase